MDDACLMEQAKRVMGNSYSPYSGFKVGAALLGKSGHVYLGTNMENASYGATICAERSALCAGISAGEREFIKLALCCEKGISLTPCGICRQAFMEFSKDLILIVEDINGTLNTVPLSALLPYTFTNEDIK